MIQSFIRNVAIILLAFTSPTVFSQTSEYFNSYPGVHLHAVKKYLQSKCWQFRGFDINSKGFVPNMEGDGAMISEPIITPEQGSGIYTPVLDIQEILNLSFNYQFNKDVNDRRCLKVYLTNSDNEIIQLVDSLELTHSKPNTIYTYDQTLQTGPGAYKIYINYQGDDGAISIAIDKLTINASLLYTNGCNQAPVAVADYFNASKNYTARGNVIINDHDPNNEAVSAYLLTGSPDGTVDLKTNGDFTFTPKPGFKGTPSFFTYSVCDHGDNQLCSEPTTVIIQFDTVNIIDFISTYYGKGVKLNWTTTLKSDKETFEIERSTDGIRYEKAGSVKAQPEKSRLFEFTDNVPTYIIKKKDLYYRLKKIAQNGTASYSKVLLVRVYKTRSIQMISVTPNPVMNDIKVNIQLNENSFVVMKVVNSGGNEILRKSAKAEKGENTFMLEGTSRLQKGLYLLEVLINSDERMMMKLIKE